MEAEKAKLVVLALVAACQGVRSPKEKPAPAAMDARQTAASVNARVVRVLRVDDGERTSFAFDVYLARPDVGVSEPERELHPDIMYLSDPSDTTPGSGRLMCDRPRTPHRCELYQLGPEELKRDQLDYLLKIRFDDGGYAAVPVTVTLPPALGLPELVEPSATPAQGSSLAMAFRDVAADSYHVAVNLCVPYAGDGINPCLDGEGYQVTRSGGTLAVDRGKVTLKDGLVRLGSTLVVSFEDSVRYTIEATDAEVVDGIEVLRTSRVEKEFER